MFYPAESLKKGGRFYLCWMADAWPLRFATMTQRQLLSCDLRKICDDLLEVMTSESGRPTNRFSLRLSSQLMRGLARLYHRKATLLLGDLCMINAIVMKNTNKKWNIQEPVLPSSSRNIRQQLQPLIIQEVQENEDRVEELIQDQTNVVKNIQDITLKETTIPEYLPQNDGFGEEHPNQTLQQLTDGNIEYMLAAAESSMHQSALGTALDVSDKSHEKTRLVVQDTLVMERISEHDMELLKKSTGGDLNPEDMLKDIPQTPEGILSRQGKEKTISHSGESCSAKRQRTPASGTAKRASEGAVAASPNQQEFEIELQTLEEPEVPIKRRRKNKLFVDKKTQISSNVLQDRIARVALELRCDKPLNDRMDLTLPSEIYLSRPAHAGKNVHSNISLTLTRLFARNLGILQTNLFVDSEMQENEQPRRATVRKSLQKSVEIEPTIAPNEPQIYVERTFEQIVEQVGEQVNMSKERMLDVSAMDQPRVTDISDLPTQVIETLSQAQKRASNEPNATSKRLRSSCYVSYKSEQRSIEKSTEVEIEVQAQEEKNLTTLLQEAGLADMERRVPSEMKQGKESFVTQRKTTLRQNNSDSETPLGSLDRTLVSLGDSDKSTDSQKFIRSHWGTEGTMLNIVKNIKAGIRPLTVKELVANGPVIANCKRIIAARCFASILKLKQHDFINVNKNPVTLEITNITLGSRILTHINI